jgi:RNA polymerase II elongation factor ELL
LYRASDDSTENGWSFGGLINYTLDVQKAQAVSAGVDKALETLKSHMASIEQEREALKCVLSDHSPMAFSSKQRR